MILTLLHNVFILQVVAARVSRRRLSPAHHQQESLPSEENYICELTNYAAVKSPNNNIYNYQTLYNYQIIRLYNYQTIYNYQRKGNQ